MADIEQDLRYGSVKSRFFRNKIRDAQKCDGNLKPNEQKKKGRTVPRAPDFGGGSVNISWALIKQGKFYRSRTIPNLIGQNSCGQYPNQT